MKKIVISLLLLALPFLVAAQEDSLRMLLTERDQLVKDYQYYNAQNSNFWGKKSKRDLLRIIDTLKEIIRKDSKIINSVKASTLRRAAEATIQKSRIEEQVKDDKVIITDNLYDLKTQIASLENLQKTRQRKIIELQEEIEQVRRKKTDSDKIIAFAGLVTLGLLLYIFNLRKKLNQLSGNRNV